MRISTLNIEESLGRRQMKCRCESHNHTEIQSVFSQSGVLSTPSVPVKVNNFLPIEKLWGGGEPCFMFQQATAPIHSTNAVFWVSSIQ